MVNLRRPVAFIPLFIMLPFFSLGDIMSNTQPQAQVLSKHEISLDNRQENAWVNEVFKDNILLNLFYLNGNSPTNQPNWDMVKKSINFEFRLDPNQTFAYHDDILEKYQGKVTKTTNAHFNFQEGFKSDGYLFGDGVCHLASLLNWVAQDALLDVVAPSNHDFAVIADIPKEYGVSIYNNPFTKGSNAQENLYITNNKDKPISFKFEYDGEKVKVSLYTRD